MRFRHLGMAILIVVLGALIVAPLGAAAQPIPVPEGPAVSGTLSDGSSFSGTLAEIYFVSDGEALYLTGILFGTATDSEGNTRDFFEPITATASVAMARTCTSLVITTDPFILGGSSPDYPTLALDPVTVAIAGAPSGNSIFNALFCLLIGPQLNATTNPMAQADLLNRLVMGSIPR